MFYIHLVYCPSRLKQINTHTHLSAITRRANNARRDDEYAHDPFPWCRTQSTKLTLSLTLLDSTPDSTPDSSSSYHQHHLAAAAAKVPPNTLRASDQTFFISSHQSPRTLVSPAFSSIHINQKEPRPTFKSQRKHFIVLNFSSTRLKQPCCPTGTIMTMSAIHSK